MKPKHASFIALAIMAVLASGCEKPATAVKSEAVATVDGDKIGEAELNLALSGLGALSEARAAEAKIRLLQALVDQRLVAQAAKKSGLDKAPEVAIAMDQASRQVLVEAYAERSFKDVGKPSETEIAEYYNQHPELFSARRIYRIQELDLTLEPSRLPEVESKLKSSHSMGDFVNWVKEQGIEGKTAVAVKPAEQIPAPLLGRFSQMKDGQVTVLQGRPGHVLVQQLQESQLQPVPLEQAHNAIEQAIVVEKRKVLMAADLKKLRETAKVEYASGYAPASEANAEDEKADRDDKTDEKPAN
ncbi:MAG: EpsD family peptidyl-prolyl cis-trans isomerase [Thiobacillus sp.]|nr:EpsD family peptidyl-prolyl cis-trans isomerase [Thiobacillus sp.]